MDLRVLVLSGDPGLSELVRAQVENLGCTCNLRHSYDDAGASIDWADAAIIDLVGAGLDDLNRLRVEAPRLRVLGIAPDAAREGAAHTAGADQVLVEPFSISALVAAVRALGPTEVAKVIDLRTDAGATTPVGDDVPWFSTR